MDELIYKILRKLTEKGFTQRHALKNSLSNRYSQVQKESAIQQTLTAGYVEANVIPPERQGKPTVIYNLTEKGHKVVQGELQRIKNLRSKFLESSEV